MHRFTRWVVRRCQDTLAGRGAKDPGRSFSRALLRAFPGVRLLRCCVSMCLRMLIPAVARRHDSARARRNSAPTLPVRDRRHPSRTGPSFSPFTEGSPQCCPGFHPMCGAAHVALAARPAGSTPGLIIHLRRLTYQLRAQAPSREGAESDVAPIRARSVEGRASCSAREASSSCSRASRPALASRLNRRTLVRLAKARRRTAGPDPACPSVHHFLPAGQIRPDGTTLLDGPGARVQLRILIWLPVLLASARSRTLRTTLNGPRTKAGPDTRRAHVVGPNIT